MLRGQVHMTGNIDHSAISQNATQMATSRSISRWLANNHPVARLDGSNPKARLRTLRTSKSEEIAAMLLDVHPKFSTAFALSLIAPGVTDIYDAARREDGPAIVAARANEAVAFRAAAELLVACSNDDGTDKPDIERIQAIGRLADDTILIDRVIEDAWGVRRVIADVSAKVRGSNLKVEFRRSDTFSGKLYETLLVEDWLRRERANDYAPVARAVHVAYGANEGLGVEYEQIDAVSRASLGISFEKFLRVIAGRGNHPVRVGAVSRDTLRSLEQEVAAAANICTEEAAYALSLVTTDVEVLRKTLRGPGFRPITGNTLRWRPLLVFNDESCIYTPYAFAQGFIVSYAKAVLNGAWPAELSDPRAEEFVAHLLKRRTKLRPIADFETAVYARAVEVLDSRYVVRNVEPKDSEAVLGFSIDAEIDCVAIDVLRSIVWVVSAKDAEQALTSSQVKNQLRRFYGGNRERMGSRSYVARLHKNVAITRRHMSELLTKFGLDNRDHAWQVRGAFVTRLPAVAAADSRRAYPILTLSELANYLSNPPPCAPESDEPAKTLKIWSRRIRHAWRADFLRGPRRTAPAMSAVRLTPSVLRQLMRQGIPRRPEDAADAWHRTGLGSLPGRPGPTTHGNKINCS